MGIVPPLYPAGPLPIMTRGEMHAPASSDSGLSRGLTLLLAVACGIMVANLYYAQTLIDRIGPDIGLSPRIAGLITTLTQLGYGAGLLLLVPLGDLTENRRLALLALGGAILGTLGIAFSRGPVTFLIASMATGICATGAQVLLPLATHLTPARRQGAVIGQIMSGLLAGIMLSRPIASFVTATWGWRAVFLISAGAMILTGIALFILCPRRRPNSSLGFARIIASVFSQFGRHRALRLRAIYQALLFVAFNLFWTAAPLALIRTFRFTQGDVALFALAGAGGALIAPVAGRLADRGRGRRVTALALAGSAGLFLLADAAVALGSVIAFALAAILIDCAVQANQITGQRIIFALSDGARARINAAYMTSMFLVGASGSLIGSATFESGGWSLSALAGAALCGLALVIFLTQDRGASGTG